MNETALHNWIKHRKKPTSCGLFTEHILPEQKQEAQSPLWCFPSMGRKGDWSNIQQSNLKNQLLTNNLDGDVVRIIQTGNFGELSVWKSTNFDNYLDFFAFSAYQDSNLWNKKENCSAYKSSENLTPSIQTSRKKFTAINIELEHQYMSILLALLANQDSHSGVEKNIMIFRNS